MASSAASSSICSLRATTMSVLANRRMRLLTAFADVRRLCVTAFASWPHLIG